MQRDESLLLDIIDAIAHILDYTNAMSYEQFVTNEEKQDAVLRRIIVMGEATKRLSLDFRGANLQVPWKVMAGMRDVVVHNYDQIKVEVVWDVVQTDLPELLILLNFLLGETL